MDIFAHLDPVNRKDSQPVDIFAHLDAPQTKAPPVDIFAHLDAPQTKAPPVDIFADLDPPPVSDEGNPFVDFASSLGTGMAKGLIGAAGLPRLLQQGFEYARPAGTHTGVKLPTSADLIAGASEYIPALKEKPSGVAGQYGEAIGEFVPLAGGGARNLLTFGVAPGAVSEAAGQATKGSSVEPYARLAGALAGGGGAASLSALASRPSVAERAVSGAVRAMSPEDIARTEEIFARGQGMGVPVTRAEAAQQATGGATNLANLQRVVEGNGGLQDFMARRPEQIDAAGRQFFDTVAPATDQPSMIGPQIGEAAGSVVSDAMSARTAAVSPFYKAAGSEKVPEASIQNIVDKIDAAITADRTGLSHGPLRELRNTLAPTEEGLPLARAAKEQPVNFGKEQKIPRPQSLLEFLSGFGLTPNSELKQIFDKSNPRKIIRRDGKSLDQALEAATEAGYFSEPEFGVRTNSPNDLIDAIRREHFGEKIYPNQDYADYFAQKEFQSIQKELRANEREIRRALPLGGWEDDFIETTKGKSALSKAADYLRTGEETNPRAAWDRAINEADKFESEAAISGIREPKTKLVTDISNLDRIKKYFRDKMELPAFSEKAIDKETSAQIGPMIGSIDNMMVNASRQYQRGKDLYAEITRDTIEPLLAGPIGKLAEKDISTRNAVNALFPQSPTPGSAGEVLTAVQALSKRNPMASRRLVRAHIEGTFNQATRDLQSGMNQFGGATFRAKLVADEQQAANLAAAITGLPNGAEVLKGFDSLMEIMATTGQRQRIGSQTAFNTEANAVLKGGSVLGDVLPTGGIKLPQVVREKLQAWNLGKNTDQIAKILTDPKGAETFRRLATAKPGSQQAIGAVAKLVYLSNQASNRANPPAVANNMGRVLLPYERAVR